MKKLALLTLVMGLGVCPVLSLAAETNATVSAEAVITEVMKVIEDEGWNAEDVADAIKSLRGLYLRDNSTAEGRRRWHGKMVGQTVVTNDETMVKTEYYEDGESFTFGPRRITSLDSVRTANARLPKRAMTNGVPVALAQARTRFVEQQGAVSNVTVAIEAGGPLQNP